MSKSDANYLEDRIVDLPCFEPAGSSVPLTESDLLAHTLITGGSGSGKTTRVIYPTMRQLLEYKASQPESKISLCLIDTKADGEMRAYLENASIEAGRSKDLQVVDETGERHIDLLEPILSEGVQAADEIAGLFAALIPESESNRYWEVTFEALILQSIRLYVLTTEARLDYSGMIEFLTRYLLQFDVMGTAIKKSIRTLQDSEDEDYEAEVSTIVDDVLATHRMWSILDPRTRSIFQSMAAPLLQSLSSTTARRVFSAGSACRIADVTEQGTILLVSVDAVREPTVAALVGTIIKGSFYDSILKRRYRNYRSARLAGLVMDDWPLCATGGANSRYSDVSALSMIRSRRGFVIAATQGLSALDLKIGVNSRRAAICNFSNIFFFRGRDLELDAYAASYFGETRRIYVDISKQEGDRKGNRQEGIMRYEREAFVPAVPVGSIGRLPLGEAYALIGDQIYNQPLCLVPDYAPTMEVEHEQGN